MTETGSTDTQVLGSEGATDPAIDVGGTAVIHQPSLIPSATVAAVAGAVLVGGALAGVITTLVAIAVIQAGLVLSWVFATALPGRIGALILGAAAAAAADAFTMRWYEHGYESVLGVLAVAIPLMFCHQLVRGVVRTRVVESLSGIAVLLIAVCASTGLLLLRRPDGGDHATAGVALAITVALVVQHLVDAVAPLGRLDPAIRRGVLGIVLGVVGGAAAGGARLRTLAELDTNHAVLVSAGAALVACLLSVGTSFTTAGVAPPRVGVLRPLAAVLVTVCLAVPAGYVLFNGLSSS
jgi:hypothetical protein